MFTISLIVKVLLVEISFFSSTSISFSTVRFSNSIISSLWEKDLGSRSKVSVSAIKLFLSSRKITLSKF